MTFLTVSAGRVHARAGDVCLYVRAERLERNSRGIWRETGQAFVDVFSGSRETRLDASKSDDENYDQQLDADHKVAIANPGFTVATVRCADHLHALDILWQLHASSPDHWRHVNRQISRLLRRGNDDGWIEWVTKLTGFNRTTAADVVQRVMCAKIWEYLVQTPDDRLDRFPRAFVEDRCGFVGDKAMLDDVGQLIYIRTEEEWERTLQNGNTGVHVSADHGIEIEAQNAEEAYGRLHALKLRGAELVKHENRDDRYRVKNCYVVRTLSDAGGVAIFPPDWREAFERKRKLHQLRVNLFYQGDPVLIGADDLAIAADPVREHQRQNVRLLVNQFMGECIGDDWTNWAPSALVHARTVRCFLTKAAAFLGKGAATLSMILSLLTFIPGFVLFVGGVFATIAGGVSHQLNLKDGLVVQGLVGVYQRVACTYGSLTWQNATAVARKSTQLVLNMLEDLRVITGWGDIHSLEELRRRVNTLARDETFAETMDLLALRYPQYRETILKLKLGVDIHKPESVVVEIFRQYRDKVIFGAFREYDNNKHVAESEKERGNTLERKLRVSPSHTIRTRYIKVLEWLVKLEDTARATKLGLLYKSVGTNLLRNFPYDPRTIADTARLLRDVCRAFGSDCTQVWDEWVRCVSQNQPQFKELARATRDEFRLRGGGLRRPLSLKPLNVSSVETKQPPGGAGPSSLGCKPLQHDPRCPSKRPCKDPRDDACLSYEDVWLRKLPAIVRDGVRNLREPLPRTDVRTGGELITSHMRTGYLNEVYRRKDTILKLCIPTGEALNLTTRRRVVLEVGMQLMGRSLCEQHESLDISVPMVRGWGDCVVVVVGGCDPGSRQCRPITKRGMFIEMDLARGKTLEQVAEERGCVPGNIYPRLRCFVDRMIDSNIAHGDLNKGNILVTDDGHINVIDWGEATMFENGGFELDKKLPPQCGTGETSIVTGEARCDDSPAKKRGAPGETPRTHGSPLRRVAGDRLLGPARGAGSRGPAAADPAPGPVPPAPKIPRPSHAPAMVRAADAAANDSG